MRNEVTALLTVVVLASLDQAVRFSTLTAIRNVVGCQPGDPFSVHLDRDEPDQP